MSYVTPLEEDSWKLVSGFFWSLPQVSFPFVDFALYPINLRNEYDYRLSTWWILWAYLPYRITRPDGDLGDSCHTISTSPQWWNTAGTRLSPTSNKYKTRNNGFRHCTIGSGNSDIWRKGNKHGKHHNCPSFFSAKFLGPVQEGKTQNPVVPWDENPEANTVRTHGLESLREVNLDKACSGDLEKAALPYPLAENSYANVWEETLKPSQLPVTCSHAPNESS